LVFKRADKSSGSEDDVLDWEEWITVTANDTEWGNDWDSWYDDFYMMSGE
jgi:hypothetical protein